MEEWPAGCCEFRGRMEIDHAPSLEVLSLKKPSGEGKAVPGPQKARDIVYS